MRISIVGGGLYGCIFAINLKKFNKNIIVDLYERNNDILTQASTNNQSRLHLGFHYPRSPETIKQTIRGFELFKKDFKECIFFPKYNFYAIHKKSKINFKDYLEILNEFNLNFTIEDKKKYNFFNNQDDIEGLINTTEGVIILSKLKKNIKKNLNKFKVNLYLNKHITNIDSSTGNIYCLDRQINQKKTDYVINTTYTNPNLGLPKKLQFLIKYELAAMVLLDQVSIKNTAITIMDGNFISLYPRDKTKYTLSSVLNTPFLKFNNFSNLEELYSNNYKNINFNKIKNDIIEDSKNYLNNSLQYKIESKMWIAPKTKLVDDTNDDTRVSKIRIYKKIISILCGKLDAIPIIYQDIKEIL